MRKPVVRGRDRFELETQRRRARAHDHLDRVRNQRTQRGRGGRGRPRWTPPAPGPLGRVAAGALALLVGGWIGDDALARWGEPWRVSAVEVHGADRLSGAEVARAAGLAPGADYRSADPDALVRALRENAWVADARAARLPGGTVVLGVRERQPLAVIQARGGPLGVDAEGRPFAVLGEREAEPLPRLRCENQPPPGEPDARLAEAIRVARSLPERGLALPREIVVGDESDPEGLVLRLPGLDARFVLGSGELDARVRKMAELMKHRPAEVAEATQVDLRFEGQAVLRGEEAAGAGGASAKEAT